MSTATITRPAVVASPLPFEPTRRNVFGSHSEMAHVWAQGRTASGRSGDGRMLFDDGTVYSHGRHFKIATLLPFVVEEEGRRPARVVLFTRARYSISTSKHVSHVSRALNGLPVVEIYVPDLSAWHASPMQVADVWETLVRAQVSGGRWGEVEAARRALDAFRAIYCPATELPADPAGWLAGLDAERAEAATVVRVKDALKVLSDLSGPKTWASGVDLATPTRGLRGGSKADTIARDLKMVRSAVKVLSPYPEHAATVTAGKAYVSRWAKLQKAWVEIEAADTFEAQRETRTATVRTVLAAVVEDAGRGDLPWQARGEFLTGALRDAPALGFTAEEVATLCRAVSLQHALNEVERDHDPVDWQVARAQVHTIRVTPDAWRNGAGTASWFDPLSRRSTAAAGTMLRRKGDRVETSRGAVVPFASAVTVYRVASLVRRGVAPGQTLGQRVGHYTLDAIDAEGNVTIGCHRLDFAEMTALACREAPDLVKARYPVPAVVA